jgi:hypothetical protein
MRNIVREYTPPADRFAEILCGLIMLLTFTLAGSVAGVAPSELILGAVSCALAWGVIDGSIFMLNSLFQKGWRTRLIAEIREMDVDAAAGRLRKEFDERYADAISTSTREAVYRDIIKTVATLPTTRPSLTKEDVMGGVGLVIIEAVCSLPAIAPLIIFGNEPYAVRLSNALLLITLSIIGYHWAGWAGWKGAGRIAIASIILGVGLLMVGVAILMGG